MRKISDRALFNHYIEKCGIDNIFGTEILDHALPLEYQKGELVLEAGSVLEYKVSYLFENGKSERHIMMIISCVNSYREYNKRKYRRN